MSRLAKRYITLPSGVSVQEDGSLLKITGSKGVLHLNLHESVSYNSDENGVIFTKNSEGTDRTSKSILGTMRACFLSSVNDVSNGFSATINLVGVGYKAIFSNNILSLNLGFSHSIKLYIPDAVTVKIEKNTEIQLSSIERQLVMRIAKKIRSFRKPEPYKGKGVFVNGETITRKSAKKQ